MASRALIVAAARRTASAGTRELIKRPFTNTTLVRGGAAPPLPPFARNPAPTEKLVENIDAVWDDGVSPELALDFDCQHVDSTEGLLWWLGGFGFFTVVYNVIKSTEPEKKKPCVNRRMNMVIDSPVVGPPTPAAVD